MTAFLVSRDSESEGVNALCRMGLCVVQLEPALVGEALHPSNS